MAAAVGIGVMRQHVPGFLLVTFGAVVTRLGAGALGRVWFAAPQWKMRLRSVGFIGGFAIGGNRWVAAQRIGGGAV